MKKTKAAKKLAEPRRCVRTARVIGIESLEMTILEKFFHKTYNKRFETGEE